MRRVIALTVALVLVPASTALAADLGELLEESREASYSAEQVITCTTPDGVQDAIIDLTQTGGEIHVATAGAPEVEVASGAGVWSLVREGAVVNSANVQGENDVSEAHYIVDEGRATDYLGREATLYRMTGDGVLRAELVFDRDVGALLQVVTFNADGSVYCERRFISFDPEVAAEERSEPTEQAEPAEAVDDSNLPEDLGGFERLDVYRDQEGFVFAYYSDGFFSFAVFRVPAVVAVESANPVTLGERAYRRAFGPGQVTYVWETREGGMALVGDLPPDMHEPVLADLPAPHDPGLFRRLWRSLFGR